MLASRLSSCIRKSGATADGTFLVELTLDLGHVRLIEFRGDSSMRFVLRPMWRLPTIRDRKRRYGSVPALLCPMACEAGVRPPPAGSLSAS